MPIRRSFAPAAAQPGKRHSRLDLTPDMISGPMDDFRHTMHVGRGGDAFGDTSFLKAPDGAPSRPPPQPGTLPPLPRHRGPVAEGDEGEPPPHQQQAPAPPKKESFLARTLRASKRSLSASRRGSGGRACSPAPSRPLSQSGSLPQLQQETGGGGGGGGDGGTGPGGPGVRASLTRSESAEGPPSQPMFPAKQRPPLVGQRLRPSHDGGGGGAGGPVRADHRIFVDGGRGGADDDGAARARGRRAPDSPPPALRHAESVLSFHVDLGPSMLGDVLGVMDADRFFGGGGGGGDDEPPLDIDENLEFLGTEEGDGGPEGSEPPARPAAPRGEGRAGGRGHAGAAGAEAGAALEEGGGGGIDDEEEDDSSSAASVDSVLLSPSTLRAHVFGDTDDEIPM